MAHLDSTAACVLSSLRSLDLSHCQDCTALSDHFTLLVGLQQLDLSNCWELQSLPHSFGRLSDLRQLNLAGCKQLTMLPLSFGDLSNLQLLDMTDSQVASLPVSFGKLGSLQALSLSQTCRENVKKLKLELGGGNRPISVYINRSLWVGEGMAQRRNEQEPYSKRLITVCSFDLCLHLFARSAFGTLAGSHCYAFIVRNTSNSVFFDLL